MKVDAYFILANFRNFSFIFQKMKNKIKFGDLKNGSQLGNLYVPYFEIIIIRIILQ